MKFTTTVQQYDDTQDLFIEIPHYVLQHLGWEEGDELDWIIEEDNTIVLRKVKDTSSTKEKHRHSDLDAIDRAFDKDWYKIKGDAIKEYLIDQTAEEVNQDIETARSYIEATNEDTYGDQGSEQQEDRTVSPPSNFPHFP